MCSSDQKLSQLVHFLKKNPDAKIIVFFITCACVDFFVKVRFSRVLLQRHVNAVWLTFADGVTGPRNMWRVNGRASCVGAARPHATKEACRYPQQVQAVQTRRAVVHRRGGAGH